MKKKVGNVVLTLVAVVFLSTVISAADLNLKLTGTVAGDYTADLRLKTNSLSSDGFDIYDFPAPTMPGNYSKFYSDIGSYNVSIDSWSTNPRTINAVFELSNAISGTLLVAWNSLSSTDYEGTLTDYGTDSSYTTSVGSADLRSAASYSATMSSATKHYFQIAIDDYTAPSSSTSSSSSSSGGSGAGTTTSSVVNEFTLGDDSFNVNIVLDDLKTREFKIKNSEDVSIAVNVFNEGLEGIILIQDQIFLGPGEEKTISFKLVAPDETGVYPGKIILRASGFEKTILVAMNVQSKDTLFDLSVNIPDKTLQPSDKLRSQFNLLPVGEKGVDVTIKYSIKDFDGKVYYENTETFYVDKEISFVKDFETDKLPNGDYLLTSEMTYIGGVATASSQFAISDSVLAGLDFNVQFVLFIVIAVAVLVAVIVSIRKTTSLNKLIKTKGKKK